MKFRWFPSSSGQYIATCIGEAIAFVTRCPAGLVANLTPLKPKCELVCTRSAIAADPSDVTKYFECLYNSATRTWVSTSQNCFKNYYFDEKQKTCVPAAPCTNGANNPPKCNACSGNRAFVDGTCTDCGTQVVDSTKTACVDCPSGSAYDATFKGCVCTIATEAIDSAADPPICKACTTAPAGVDPTTKKCVCSNKAVDPFTPSTPCLTCADGTTVSASTSCPA